MLGVGFNPVPAFFRADYADRGHSSQVWSRIRRCRDPAAGVEVMTNPVWWILPALFREEAPGRGSCSRRGARRSDRDDRWNPDRPSSRRPGPSQAWCGGPRRVRVSRAVRPLTRRQGRVRRWRGDTRPLVPGRSISLVISSPLSDHRATLTSSCRIGRCS